MFVNRVQSLLEEDTSHYVPSDWVPTLFSHKLAPLVDLLEDCNPATVDSESLLEPSEALYVML